MWMKSSLECNLGIKLENVVFVNVHKLLLKCLKKIKNYID